MVFSPDGDLLHDIDLGCAPPDGGIDFANGYAFVDCTASGFFGRLYVIDLESLDIVKEFDVDWLIYDPTPSESA